MQFQYDPKMYEVHRTRLFPHSSTENPRRTRRRPTLISVGSTDHVVTDSIEDLQRSLKRQEMVKLIRSFLKDTDGPNAPIVHDATTNFATALEKHLYRTASSFESYLDKETLSKRLRLVTVALIQRRLQKSRRSHRFMLLRRILGDKKYKEATELVQTIEALRVQQVSSACSKCLRSLCKPEEHHPTLKAQKTMPEAVRKLFFDTHLPHAVQKGSLSSTSSQDWDGLIQEAIANIESFRSWQVNKRDSLVPPTDYQSSAEDSTGDLNSTVLSSYTSSEVRKDGANEETFVSV